MCVIEEDDYPIIENSFRNLKFVPRRISHPNFQNISAHEAQEILLLQSPGQVN